MTAAAGERPGRAEQAKGQVRAARSRRPWVDHAFRALDRNTAVLGGQIAGALTYFGFLSFFPLLALTFSIVGYVSNIYPAAQDTVTEAVEAAFPGLIGTGPGQIDLQDVIDARAASGIIGLLGLLYAGLGWVDSLRDGLRRVFDTLNLQLSFVRKKTLDVLVLLLLGVSLLASLAVSSFAVTATTQVLDLVSLGDSGAAKAVLRVLSVLLSLAADTLIFAIVISRLSGARLPWRRVRSGALLAAVGFEVLKLFAGLLIGRTTDNPIYASFGVMFGLLVWINFVSRLTIFAAAWTATEPYSLAPGGIGAPGTGRRMGIAAATEPVRVVAPGDYEVVPAGPAAPAGGGKPTRTWRLTALGAGLGAAAAALIGRRRRRRRRDP